MMEEIDKFFRQQHERVHLPDEDIEDYFARISKTRSATGAESAAIPRLAKGFSRHKQSPNQQQAVVEFSRPNAGSSINSDAHIIDSPSSRKRRSHDQGSGLIDRARRRPAQRVNTAEQLPTAPIMGYLVHESPFVIPSAHCHAASEEGFPVHGSQQQPLFLPHSPPPRKPEEPEGSPLEVNLIPCMDNPVQALEAGTSFNADCVPAAPDPDVDSIHTREVLHVPRKSTNVPYLQGLSAAEHTSTSSDEIVYAEPIGNHTEANQSKKSEQFYPHLRDASDITTPDHSTVHPAPSSSSPINCSSDRSETSLPVPKRTSAMLKKEKSKKKAKPKLITPLDYARTLQAVIPGPVSKKKRSADLFLEGKRIYYYGGDMVFASEETRKRMAYLTRRGATLVPVYDPKQVTHIITDAPKKSFLRVLKIKSLDEVPTHIPILKWDWIISGEGGGKMARYHDHASFSERVQINADIDSPTDILPGAKQRNQAGIKGKGKARGVYTLDLPSNGESGEFSRISESTPDKGRPSDGSQQQEILPSPPQSPKLFSMDKAQQIPAEGNEPASTAANASTSRMVDGPARWADKLGQNDPLAEFYAQAWAERDAEQSQERGDSGEDASAQKEPVAPRVGHTLTRTGMFMCDNKDTGSKKRRCINQDVIDKLTELKELHRAKPSTEDAWRVFSYDKAIRALRNYSKRITCYEEAVAIRGVGHKTAQKIMEILQTGELRRLGYERTGDVEAVTAFQGIYGVGRHTAFKWYASGCRTLDDVKAGKCGVKLSPAQEIGLKFYEDINTRMPRSEAEEIFNLIRPIALSIDSRLFVEIMGSFRRGKPDCGDIDILITRPTDDGKTHIGILRRLLSELHRQGIITEDLCLPDDWADLELVYRGLCRKDSCSPRRRIDFLTVPYESRGAALLYYTGDDIFNRSMRLKANKMGYSLNQKGLYAGVIRDPTDRRQKLNEGTIIASATEREIFDILEVPWQEPHERIRG